MSGRCARPENPVREVLAIDRRVSVAPMMDWTDRHCRYFLRGFSPRALLYTEMITAAAIVHGDTARLLRFSAEEQPLALQLGGSDPRLLAAAARAGADGGYDEINLNCGCPSDRVHAGAFGACLMQAPERVAECVAAMREAVRIPVTVKMRIGVLSRAGREGALANFDERDYERLQEFHRPRGCGQVAVTSSCMRARPCSAGFRPGRTARCRRCGSTWCSGSSGISRAMDRGQWRLAHRGAERRGARTGVTESCWAARPITVRRCSPSCMPRLFDDAWTVPDAADIVARMAAYAEREVAAGEPAACDYAPHAGAVRRPARCPALSGSACPRAPARSAPVRRPRSESGACCTRPRRCARPNGASTAAYNRALRQVYRPAATA